MNEVEILCDCIEKYIELANINKNTLDDYISIIALIKILQKQYKEYYEYFQKYIEMFDKNGILEEYNITSNNTAKNIFNENNWEQNEELAYDMLYDYFPNCPSRYINYLILFALCGKPITEKQKYIMSEIFEGNYHSFSKQKIYYSQLYIKETGVFNNAQYYRKYKDIAIGYRKEKDNTNFEKYMLIAMKYGPPDDMLIRYYISEKKFDKAKKCIDKIILMGLEKNNYIKQLIEYYNFKLKYPYIRKELLEMFNIDIKTFNILTKDIKNDENYFLDGNYSNNIIKYINDKLN